MPEGQVVVSGSAITIPIVLLLTAIAGLGGFVWNEIKKSKEETQAANEKLSAIQKESMVKHFNELKAAFVTLNKKVEEISRLSVTNDVLIKTLKSDLRAEILGINARIDSLIHTIAERAKPLQAQDLNGTHTKIKGSKT